ncbi:MAG TPA: hypothetical protein VJ346_11140 [Bacteroidales bacterium]|nr:hypothetical protein [Bacteroidales bacterium]
MKRNLMLLQCLLASICLACDSPSISRDPEQASVNPGKSSSHQTGNLIKFKKFSYIDQQGTGSEAFSFLMPINWTFKGGLIWLTDNPGMPATSAFTVSNPKGSEAFEVFPNQPFFWSTNQGSLMLHPVGSKYFGNEVRPIMNAGQAMRQVVLPRFRGSVGNLQIIKEEPVPELARAISAASQPQPGLTSNFDASKVRIEYNLGGKVMEEEIYAVVEAYTYPIQSWGSVVYNTNWTVSYIFSYKAEKGKLEPASKVFETITYSFQVNKNWFNKYVQLVEFLIKNEIQRIHNIGDFSRRLAQMSDEIREDNLKSWYDRQAVGDRIAEDFSQYMRGVDEYYDPIEGKPVELPSGYDNAWTNANGEYIISDNPNYNPNIGSNLNWERMKRK